MKEIDWGHWINKTGIPDEKIDLNDYFGFIYELIFDDGRTYIGKKQFWRQITRPPLKGKKRRRRDWIESDWRKYGSSSKTVHDRLVSSPECIRERGIIAILSSKSTLALGETLAISLSRLYNGDRRPLNERIEQVRGGYKATPGDESQLDNLVRRIINEQQ